MMHTQTPETLRWTHGGVTPQGMLPDASVLDLSVNINPYGPDPELTTFLQRQAFDQYPDPRQTALRQGLAELRQCRAEEILPGNGCNELFWAAARAFLKAGARWLAVEPNYSEFARAAHSVAAQRVVFEAKAQDGFQWSLASLRQLLSEQEPVLLMLSNPCSPTGFFQDPAGLSALAAAFPRTLFCLDHSFLSLSPHWATDRAITWPDNVLRFYSLTKDFAIAGLRLGFVQGPEHFLQAMAQEMPTWSVNSLAQAAGLWITRHHDRLAPSRQKLLDDHTQLEAGLLQRSLPFIPSQTIFTMLRPPAAAQLISGLWQRHRILIRSCASYGLPEWVRVAAKPEPMLRRFWKALDEELSCRN